MRTFIFCLFALCVEPSLYTKVACAERLLDRTESKLQDTWDLTPLFSSLEEWQCELQEIEKIDWNLITRPFQEAKTLSASEIKQLFDTFFLYERRISNLCAYAHLLH